MNGRRGGSVFGAFLLGGLGGAVLGVLFAPRSGVKTREMLNGRASDYLGQASQMYATGVDRVSDAVETVKVTAGEKAEQLHSKVEDVRERLQEHVVESAEVAKSGVDTAAAKANEGLDRGSAATKSAIDDVAEKAKSVINPKK